VTALEGTAVRRPARTWLPLAAALAACALAAAALPWDFSALLDAGERAQALERARALGRAFVRPDLSGATLALGSRLALQTLATAALGTALGAALGYFLALGASRAVVLGAASARRPSRIARAGIELARLALDFLRGIPDFAWALLILPGPGPGPLTGILALALSVGGILGKIYSELWDALDERTLAAVSTSGGGRLAKLFYGLQPRTAKAMLSYTLMRGECAVRNASVIGVVGGGGLGGELFDQFHFGRYGTALTLLLCLFALTAAADLSSSGLRRALHLRGEPEHARPHAAGARARWLGLGAAALVLALLALSQRQAFGQALGELRRVEWGWLGQQWARLLRPDLSPRTLAQAARGTVVPMGLGLLSTLAASLAAALLAYGMSSSFQLFPARFTLERASASTRLRRAAGFALARALALVARATPEVAWLLVFASVLQAGVLPAVLAVAVHSTGVLARVFTEAVDDVRSRHLETFHSGSRTATYLFAAVPEALRSWKAYATFQLEVNVRAGLVLGMIGAGGLGDSFHTSVSFWSLERASTFALAMVLLTLLLDRSSRALRLAQVESGG
jgi:phosphonate transport system permease protein